MDYFALLQQLTFIKNIEESLLYQIYGKVLQSAECSRLLQENYKSIYLTPVIPVSVLLSSADTGAYFF